MSDSERLARKLGNGFALAVMVTGSIQFILVAALHTWMKQLPFVVTLLFASLPALPVGIYVARSTINKSLHTLDKSLGRLVDAALGDLTPSFENKSNLQTVLSSMGESLVVVDRNKRILMINKAAMDTWSLTDPILRQPLVNVFRQYELLEMVTETMDTGKSHVKEMRLQPSRMQQWRVHTTPLKTPGEDINGCVILLWDVTELRHLERVRSDFIANVSHELRTPLTSMLGFVETLIDGAAEDPHARGRFLNILQRETHRMMTIINDLLSLSRIESGPFRLTLSSVPLAVLAGDIRQSYAVPAREKGLYLNVDASDAPKTWVLNANLMRQALANLMDNAIKYTDTGHISLTLRGIADTLVIDVTDTGIGIPYREHQRIFERFYRVDKARSRDAGGTGLGLSIVRNIVTRHSGRIEVMSTVDGGTTIRLYIPKPVPTTADHPITD